MVGVLGCEVGTGSIFSPDIPNGLAPLLGGESGFDAHRLSVNLSRTIRSFGRSAAERTDTVSPLSLYFKSVIMATR